MDSILRDVRHAVRGLAARRTYSFVVVATLALVIAAATAVLAVVNATLLRPLPYPHADRVAQLFLMPPGTNEWTQRNPQSLGTLLRFRQRLQQTELVEGLWSRERVLGGDAEPEVVVAAGVSPGMFGLFGGTPALGRTFTEIEDQADAKVVVLGHAVWERRFGRDRSIVGKTVLIDRAPYEVIGVMAPAFVTGFVLTDLWVPLSATEASVMTGNTNVQTFARLRPGVSVRQLSDELATVMQAVVAENPKVWTGWTPLAVNLRDAQFRLQMPSVLALAGGVVALLLIACANLGNLMLAQTLSRRPELALRAALGGRRGDLVRLQIVETLLLAVPGAIAGLLLGQWLLPAILALDPSLARTFGEISIDWRVLLGAAVTAIGIALVAGLVPLLRELLRRDLAGLIIAGSKRTIGSRRDQRMRAMLVAAECALSVVLLVSAALLLSAFDRSARIDPGFDSKSVLAAQMRMSAAAYPTESARADLIARVIERVRAVPGVVSAGATLNRFIPGFFLVTRVDIEGRPAPDGQPYVVQFRRASQGYFETMRIPLLSGREFSASDTTDQQPVAIVSRKFADQFWPGEDPIGRRVRRGTNPKPLTVVGVVGDVSDVSITDPPAATIYIAYSQNSVAIQPVSLVLRTAGDPRAMTSAIRAAVLSVDPQQPIDSVTTVEQFLADSLGPQRFRGVLLLLISGIGVALAGLGVYGVTARSVAERSGELGVRLALGATPGSLGRLVVWQSLRSVFAGLGAGVILAWLAGATLFSLVPNLQRGDAWITAPAVLALAAIAAVAAIIPSRRAVSLAPVAALRLQ